MSLSSDRQERLWKALDVFQIELPSWGFANTGTRFGKFTQSNAATTTAENWRTPPRSMRSQDVVPQLRSTCSGIFLTAQQTFQHFATTHPGSV